MKKYYIHNGYSLLGPCTSEEIKQQNVSCYSSIWHETSSGLTTVNSINEINRLRNISVPGKSISSELLPVSEVLSDIYSDMDRYKRKLYQKTILVLGTLGIIVF